MIRCLLRRRRIWKAQDSMAVLLDLEVMVKYCLHLARNKGTT